MLQQISESELTLMQIIWQNEGHALYSQIMEQLAAQQNDWKKKHSADPTFAPGGKRLPAHQQNRPAQRVRRHDNTAGISSRPNAKLCSQNLRRQRQKSDLRFTTTGGPLRRGIAGN